MLIYKIVQYYLPPYSYCPLKFMRDLLNGKKKVSDANKKVCRCFGHTLSKVYMFQATLNWELRASGSWLSPILVTLNIFPIISQVKLPPRKYLFNLLHTIDPDLVEDKIMKCHNDRKVGMKLEDSNFIEIVPDLYEEIINSTYRSSKPKLLILM